MFCSIFQYTDTCSLTFLFVAVELYPFKHGCPKFTKLRRMRSYPCSKDYNSGMPWTLYREQIFTKFSKFQTDLHSFLNTSLEQIRVKDLKAEEVLKVST